MFTEEKKERAIHGKSPVIRSPIENEFLGGGDGQNRVKMLKNGSPCVRFFHVWNGHTCRHLTLLLYYMFVICKNAEKNISL